MAKKKTVKEEMVQKYLDDVVEIPESEKASMALTFEKYKESCLAHSEAIRQNRQHEAALESQANQLARDFNGRIEAAMAVAEIQKGEYFLDSRDMVFRLDKARR